MHDEQGTEFLGRKQVPRGDRGRKDILGRGVDAKPRQILDDLAARTTRRIGDEFMRNAKVAKAPDRIERTRQNILADANDALNVEQNGFGGGFAGNLAGLFDWRHGNHARIFGRRL